MNPIGIVSTAYARPFTAQHFPMLQRVRSAGLDFIELLVPEPGEVGIGELRVAVEDAGLAVALTARVTPSRDPTADDAAVRKAGREYLKRCTDVAVAMGARILGGPIYGAPLATTGRTVQPADEKKRKQRLVWAAEALAEAGVYATSLDVILAIEPLNRFETDMVNTARQAMELIAAARAPGLAVMLDTFHMNMEEGDMVEAIRACGRHLVHFRAAENHRGFLGTGHIDWTTVVHALAQVRYAGPISLAPLRRQDDRIVAVQRPQAQTDDVEITRSARLMRKYLAAAGG